VASRIWTNSIYITGTVLEKVSQVPHDIYWVRFYSSPDLQMMSMPTTIWAMCCYWLGVPRV
jgi:hypothetical protein